MALPSNYTVVPLRGMYVDLLGNPVAGTITFTPNFVALTDPSALTVVIGRAISTTLSGGAFSISLPCTDDPDLSPTNFTYTVTESFTGLVGRTYSISVPSSAAGTGLDLSTLAFTATSSGVPAPTGGTNTGGGSSLGTSALLLLVNTLSSGVVGGGAGAVAGGSSLTTASLVFTALGTLTAGSGTTAAGTGYNLAYSATGY